MRISLLLPLLLGGVFPPRLSAQQLNIIPPVHTLKVMYAASIPWNKGKNGEMGSLDSASDSSLVIPKNYKLLQPTATKTASIPLGYTWKAKAKSGSQNHKGLLIGMGVGALVGGFIGYATYKEPAPSKGSINFRVDAGPGGNVAIGGLLGFVAGALVGAFIDANAE